MSKNTGCELFHSGIITQRLEAATRKTLPSSLNSGNTANSKAHRWRQLKSCLGLVCLATASMLSVSTSGYDGNISNIDKTASDGSVVTTTNPQAQLFTTGSVESGYHLKTVTLKLKKSGTTTKMPDVSLWEGSSNGEAPKAELTTTTISKPKSTLTTAYAEYEYTCTQNCELESNKHYAIFAEPESATEPFFWAQNTDTTQTNSPSTEAWAIADKSKYRFPSGNINLWLDTNPSAVKLLKVSYEALVPDLWVENIRHYTANLVLRNWTSGDWSVLSQATSGYGRRCIDTADGLVFGYLDGLRSDTDYTVTTHRGHGCSRDGNALLDTDSFTTLSSQDTYPSLSASNITANGATLTISNHVNHWWYHETANESDCTAVAAGTTSVDLTGLNPSTAYQYAAYSAAGCLNSSTTLEWFTDNLNFTTTGSLTLTVANQSDNSVTITVGGLTSNDTHWSYFVHRHGELIQRCTTLPKATVSATVTGLNSGASYTFQAYIGSSCAVFDNMFSIVAHTYQLTSENVGQSSATLKLSNYEGDWWHKQESSDAQGMAGAMSSGNGTLHAGGNRYDGYPAEPFVGHDLHLEGLQEGGMCVRGRDRQRHLHDADSDAASAFAAGDAVERERHARRRFAHRELGGRFGCDQLPRHVQFEQRRKLESRGAEPSQFEHHDQSRQKRFDLHRRGAGSQRGWRQRLAQLRARRAV